MDIATFRQQFPEFADTTKYPTPMVTMWSSVGDKLVNVDYWNDMKDFAVSLFTAHNLVLAKNNLDANAVGGTPGQTAGPAQSKTVGAASVSYDTQSSLELNAGHWNLTTYGKQFIRYARMFGAGGVQL